MAVTLPDERDLGGLPGMSGQRAIGTPNATPIARGAEAIGEGVKALGKGIENLGTGVADYQLNVDRAEYWGAHSKFLVAKSQLDDQFLDDTDYQTQGERYTTELQKRRDEVGKNLAGPMKERFIDSTDETIGLSSVKQNRTAFHGMAKDKLADVDADNDKLLAAAAANPENKEAILGQVKQNIDSMVALKYIDARTAQKYVKSFDEKLSTAIFNTELNKAVQSGDSTRLKALIEEMQRSRDNAAQPAKPGPVSDISGDTGLRTGGDMAKVAGLIVHHTGGGGGVDGVVSTLKQRGLSVQYVIDRDGQTYRVTPEGKTAFHIMNGWGPAGEGKSNRNMEGVEVIARNDGDVTEAQKAAVVALAQERGQKFGYDPATSVFGHGEVNPGHKEKDEGMSSVNILRDYRQAQGDEGMSSVDILRGKKKLAAATGGTASDATAGDATAEPAQPKTPTRFDSLDAPTRERLIQHGQTELLNLKRNFNSQEALEAANVKDMVESDLQSTATTGKGVDELNYDRVSKALGPVAAEQWKQAHDDSYEVFQRTADLYQLDNQELEQRKLEVQPQAGDPRFSRKQKIADAIVKGIDKIKTLRDQDPAAAVAGSPSVQRAHTEIDPKDPSSWINLGKARLAEQTAAGIPEDNQSPLTKSEAMQLSVPLRRMLPGQERETITALAEQLDQMFGVNADKAFQYVLRVHSVSGEAAKAAVSIMKKLSLGEVTPRAEGEDFDMKTELAAADKSMKTYDSFINPTSDLGVTEFGAVVPGGPLRDVEPGANIPKAAIVELRANPDLAAEFNRKYSPDGKDIAKDILGTYSKGKGAAKPQSAEAGP